MDCGGYWDYSLPNTILLHITCKLILTSLETKLVYLEEQQYTPIYILL